MAAISQIMFQMNFANEKFCIWLKFHWNLFLVVQLKVMAGRLIGDKPLSETMLTRFTDAYTRH